MAVSHPSEQVAIKSHLSVSLLMTAGQGRPTNGHLWRCRLQEQAAMSFCMAWQRNMQTTFDELCSRKKHQAAASCCTGAATPLA